MTIAALIPIAINVSMGLVVLALGLHARMEDATYLLRRPGLLVRSIVAMNVVMPILAALAALVFDLAPAVKLALVALALSPVPPILPNKQTKAGGTSSYVIGLLVAAAALSLVLVPIGMELIAAIFGLDVAVRAREVLPVVLLSVIAPLVIGIVIHQIAPDFAKRIAGPVSIFGVGLLLVSFLPVLVAQWSQILDVVGNGTLFALAVFTLVGVAVGHFLGGPGSDDRSVLALATGTRHPGVALAIAASTFPDEKTVFAVVLWHLIVGAIVSVPYVRWRKRMHSDPAGAPPSVSRAKR